MVERLSAEAEFEEGVGEGEAMNSIWGPTWTRCFIDGEGVGEGETGKSIWGPT